MSAQIRALAVWIGLCTFLILAAILWPRFMPRYVVEPNVVVDRWTGDRCHIVGGDICAWESVGRTSFRRVGNKWESY